MIKTTITLDSSSQRHLDENGYLHVASSHISKAAVNPYYGREIPGWESLGLDPDHIYQVFRPGEELAKGAASFNGLPLHLEHHVDSADNPQKEHRVGSLGTDAAFNAPYLDNSLTITDRAAIVGIDPDLYGETEEEKKSPKIKELSAAYMYDPVAKAGTFEGQPYDIIMTNIRGNHVALVREGRAGPDVVVADQQIDAKDANKKGFIMSILEKIKQLISQAESAGAAPHPGGEEEAKAAMSGDNGNGGEGDPNKKAQDDQAEELGVKLFALVDSIDDKELADKIKALVQEMRAEQPAGDNAGEGQEPAKAAPAVDNDLKEAMDKCGLDSEDPVAAASFVKALEYVAETMEEAGEAVGAAAEKAAEGAAADEGKKDESALAAMDRKLRKIAKDSALAKSQAVREVEAKIKAKTEAARKVRPLVGELDIFAFDSAGDIYRHALSASGLKTKTTDAEALRTMVDQQVTHRREAVSGLALDSRSGSVVPDKGPLAHLSHIKLSK